MVLKCGCMVTTVMDNNDLFGSSFCMEHRAQYWTPDLSTKDIADKIWEISKEYMKEAKNELSGTSDDRTLP